MSLIKPLVFDGSVSRSPQAGDILAAAEVVPATDTTNANLTITGAMLLQGLILRNPAGVSNENIDTAANLVAAFTASANNGPPQPGTTFRVTWVNTSANALTVQATANTGVTVNRGTVAASVSRTYLVTINNATPAQTYACTTTNGSAVVGMTQAQAATLSVGMIVTNAVANLQGQTIIMVNISAGTVTLSGNANATNGAPGVAIAFSPRVTLDGL